MDSPNGQDGVAADEGLLPGPSDFDATNPANLDAIWAWEQFGGKTVDDAFEHFSSNPFAYSEAFAFMGPRAFRYYFPVLQRYIASVIPGDPEDDCDLPVIGSSICGQLAMSSENSHPASFLSTVVAAGEALLKRLPGLQLDLAESDHIRWEWEEVVRSARRRSTTRNNEANKPWEIDA